jgi:hypothetical protein
VVREGELRVKFAGRHEETLSAGGFLNEETLLGRGVGPWAAKARTECTVEWIPADRVRRIPIVMWKLLEAQDRRRCKIALAGAEARLKPAQHPRNPRAPRPS